MPTPPIDDLDKKAAAREDRDAQAHRVEAHAESRMINQALELMMAAGAGAVNGVGVLAGGVAGAAAAEVARKAAFLQKENHPGGGPANEPAEGNPGVGADAIVVAAAAGAGATAGGIVGRELIKENKKEIGAAARAVAAGAAEVASTPADVGNHIRQRPVTAAVESIICPPLVIIDAKLRKLFGN